MTARPDPDRLIQAFLEEGLTELPDRAYDAVRAEIDHTRQRVVFGPWREPRLSNVARLAIAAAAVLVVAVVGINLVPRLGGVGGPEPSSSAQPSPTAQPTATTPPTPIPTATLVARRPPDRGDIQPGRYWLMGPGGYSLQAPGWPRRVSVAIPAGWKQNPPQHGAGIQTDDNSFMFATRLEGARLSGWSVANLFGDFCPQATLADPPLGPTVDDLVSGLATFPGVEVTLPTDVTLVGFHGKSMHLTTVRLEDCDTTESPATQLPLWSSVPEEWGEFWTQHSWIGWQHQFWILDVEGLRFVIDAAHAPDAPAEQLVELQQMVDSIDIQP